MTKLKKWLADLPIQSKLNLINLTVVLVALIPFVVITLSYEHYSVQRSNQLAAETQADIIRDNIAAATAFSDPKTASEILQALRSSPDVIQAVLLLPGNVVLARYASARELPAPIDASDGRDATSDNGSYIRVTRVVRLKQDAVGWLAVDTTTSALQDRLRLFLLVNFLATVLGFAVAYPLSRLLKESITRPLSDLMALAHHVTTHQDYSAPGQENRNQDEIGRLARAFVGMLSGIRQRDLKLSQMAYYDNVTGLANRHYFMERLNQAIANSQRYGTRCCVMFIDLDNFKTVNDSYGHHVGDELLREVANHLSHASRNNDFVCRLGGDEFAIILDEIKDLTGPGVLAKKIIAALSEPMNLHGKNLQVGASIGLAACPDHATETADLLKAADTAMYWAKEQGKNCFRFYTV